MNRDTETQAQFEGAKLKERLDGFEKLMEILPKLASRINKKELIMDIIKMVNKLVDADHTHVRVIDWLKNELVLEEYVKEEDSEPRYPEFSSVSAEKAIAGRVFRNRKSEPPIPDAQEDEDFIKYLKEVKNENLIKYLKKIGPAMVVPLFLDKKAIGVLTATKWRKTEYAPLPSSFTDNDKIILKHFADYVAVALRNAWLFEAATWQPSQKDEKEKVVNLEMLCCEVVNEAMRRTGASNGRVRFVDWKWEYLVPGALKWPDGHEPDPRVCVRKIGMCPAGVAAKTQKPYLSNDLQNDSAFKRFFNYTKACRESYQVQLEALKERQKSAGRSGSSLSAVAQHLKEGCPEIVEELEMRLNMLAGLDSDPIKFANSLKKQIEVVERLSEAWREYVNHHLTKWNSEVAVPILLGNRPLGVLNVHSTEKDWFTDSDKAILQALTGRVALAVMEHQQKVLNKIQEIGQRMIASSNFDDMAELVAEGIKQVAFLIVPEKIFPLLYSCKNPIDPQRLVGDKQHFGEMFDPQQRASATEDEINLLLNVPIRNEGLGWDAIKKLAENPDEPVFIVRENVDDPVSGGSPTAQKYGVMTTACIPMAFGRIVYGLLYIHINERHFFTKLEKEALTLFVAQAAIVLKNLTRRPEEETYEALCGDKLISECIMPTLGGTHEPF